MLKNLRIQNYALIQDLNVSWEPGFSTITGETGAGKSIMLGALYLLMGNRADLSVLRDQSKKCIIEAEFDLSKKDLESFFQTWDLDYEPNCLIRREITPAGKSRSFVNDTPVNLTVLKPLGNDLLDIHSQHQNLLLSSSDFQLNILDEFSGNSSKLAAYKAQFQILKDIQERLAAATEKQASLDKEADFKNFQFQELYEAKLEDKAELDELNDEFSLLSNTESLQEGLASLIKLGENEDLGFQVQLNEASRTLENLSGKWEKLQPLSQRFTAMKIELDDALLELNQLADQMEADPERLATVSDRINLLNALLQKHHLNDLAELIELRDQLDSDLQSAGSLKSEILALDEAYSKQKEIVKKSALELREQRQKHQSKLEDQVISLLDQLGMSQAQFKLDFKEKPLSIDGLDKIDFLFTANKGMQAQALSKVASGGEMARIMLALKWILCKHKQLATIIFDEIDTGVSGEIAGQMASLMLDMAQHTQVISITHLANIASRGKVHYKVEKNHDEDLSQTKMRQLNKDERILELAEMIGGRNPGDHALASAKAMLDN